MRQFLHSIAYGIPHFPGCVVFINSGLLTVVNTVHKKKLRFAIDQSRRILRSSQSKFL